MEITALLRTIGTKTCSVQIGEKTHSWRLLVRVRGLIFGHGGAPCVLITVQSTYSMFVQSRQYSVQVQVLRTPYG